MSETGITSVPQEKVDRIIKAFENSSDRSGLVILLEQAQDNWRELKGIHAGIGELSARFTGCENAVTKQTLRMDAMDSRQSTIEGRQDRIETAQRDGDSRLAKLEAWKDEKIGAVEGRRSWLKWLIQTILGSSVLAGIWHYADSIVRHK